MEQRNNILLQNAQEESIRLMQENASSMADLQHRNEVKVGSATTQTTETRLQDVRESMTFTRARNTIRRTGWYFTEPYAPCEGASGLRDFDRREV